MLVPRFQTPDLAGEDEETQLSLVKVSVQISGGKITTCTQCFGSGSGWIRVFSPIWIRIRVLKVRICTLINLWDLNDGFDTVLEEPDQKGQC